MDEYSLQSLTLPVYSALPTTGYCAFCPVNQNGLQLPLYHTLHVDVRIQECSVYQIRADYGLNRGTHLTPKRQRDCLL